MWRYLLVQVVEDGYEFFAKRQLVTLFSAPNYCGEFDNAGAMMSVDETLMCSFQVREEELSFSSLSFAFTWLQGFPVSLQMHQVYLHVIGLANFLCRFALDHLLKVVLYSVSVVLFQKVSALPTDAFYSQYKAKKAWLLNHAAM